MRTRTSVPVAVLAMVWWSAAPLVGQQHPTSALPATPATNPGIAISRPTNASAAGTASTPVVAPVFKPASVLLQPGLDAVKQALPVVHVEKWKVSGVIKDEADANLNSIRKDVEITLPGLLTTADSAPDSVTKVLPAYRNVEALYDVLLRVTQSTRMFGPSQQDAALEQAMTSLDAARRALADQMQTAAAAQDKQVGDLRAALKAAQTAAPPAPVVTPPPPTPTKKKKPAAKAS